MNTATLQIVQLQRFPITATLLVDICTKYHIHKLSLFGSVLREDFQPDTSDIDMLVEFEQGHTPGLAFFGIADEFQQYCGRTVDVCTKEDISTYFRETVLREAVPIYEAGNVYEFH
jgi:uncharacterized protein